MHTLHYKFQCMMMPQYSISVQFHHTINIPTSYPLKINAVASTYCRKHQTAKRNSLKTSNKHLTACIKAVSYYVNTIIEWIDGYCVLEYGATSEGFTAAPYCYWIRIVHLMKWLAVILGLCTCFVYSAIYRTPIPYTKSPLFLSPDICRMVVKKGYLYIT